MSNAIANIVFPASVLLATSPPNIFSSWLSSLGAAGAFIWLLYVSLRQELRQRELQKKLDEQTSLVINLSEKLAQRCSQCELAKAANSLLLKNSNQDQTSPPEQ